MNKNIDNGKTSSGYNNQLFSIYNNNENFCLKEWKSNECILSCKER